MKQDVRSNVSKNLQKNAFWPRTLKLTHAKSATALNSQKQENHSLSSMSYVKIAKTSAKILPNFTK